MYTIHISQKMYNMSQHINTVHCLSMDNYTITCLWKKLIEY